MQKFFDDSHPIEFIIGGIFFIIFLLFCYAAYVSSQKEITPLERCTVYKTEIGGENGYKFNSKIRVCKTRE